MSDDKHDYYGNCWDDPYGSRAPICLEHREPRGSCRECPRCYACDPETEDEMGANCGACEETVREALNFLLEADANGGDLEPATVELLGRIRKTCSAWKQEQAKKEKAMANGHNMTGNCLKAAYSCAECGEDELCDVCHDHCEPRGDCTECPVCDACEDELEEA